MPHFSSSKKRIGILNLWWTPNYGAILTGLALQKQTEEFGHESTLISYAYVFSEGAAHEGSVFHEFAKNELSYTPTIRYANELDKINNSFDCFIVGSDQVWRYEYTEHTDFSFFFKFVAPEKKLISYAASIGISEWTWPEKHAPIISCLMQRFDAVSVRESSAVPLCRDYMDTDAQWVLDPVFFYDKEWWGKLADKALYPLPEKYIATYILDKTAEIQAHIDSFSSLPIINTADIKGVKASVYYWLKSIRDSSCLVTDSYHGMCFAIIFRKRFVVFGNKSRGITRFESILNFCQLRNHLAVSENLENLEQLINRDVDEASLDSLLAPFISQSKSFLEQSLKGRTRNNKLNYTLYLTLQTRKEINSINKKFYSLLLLKYKVLSLFSWGKKKAQYIDSYDRIAQIRKSL